MHPLSLSQAICHAAEPGLLPSGDTGLFLGTQAVADMAATFDAPGWEVEALALDSGVIPKRYSRSRNAIAADQQARLLRSRVAQVGLGGLGGNLLEMLVRSGVGRIRCADGDVFEETNLNRQMLSTMGFLNRPKAEAARDRSGKINPSVEMEAANTFLDAKTMPEFLQGADVAVDALGGLDCRPLLRRTAAEAGIPLVTGALAGWTGYAAVVLPGSPGPADFMGTDNAAEETLGCPAPTVTVVASIMAAEIIAILSGAQPRLAGKMLLMDLQSMSFETVSL
ncbi:HesA/MoeB/ThiF family protein [Pseudodesulfovibrio tunisiensis]|uniref:HesA/MoeB/ThiF family protein n=1 Tax=Pseudodesulfovibrio tunisiensis TaxID=463192 RepID=UPI001FB39EF9|nr:HesA/MoeB/ThiF family protein [Pseudodesulfovibrio tunisiensis]